MTPLETAARLILASVGPIEATSPTAVVPVRAELLADLARAVEELERQRVRNGDYWCACCHHLDDHEVGRGRCRTLGCCSKFVSQSAMRLAIPGWEPAI